MILQRYADEHHFLNTKFFVDDGFSGVSFEREGDVYKRQVEYLCIKDMSRMGRDYLKAGQIMEILRQRGVRRIAINDGVDSARGDDDFTPVSYTHLDVYKRQWDKQFIC